MSDTEDSKKINEIKIQAMLQALQLQRNRNADDVVNLTGELAEAKENIRQAYATINEKLDLFNKSESALEELVAENKSQKITIAVLLERLKYHKPT